MRVRIGATVQRGFALLGLVAVLVAGALFLAVQFFSSEAVNVRREKATGDALVQARDALAGYLVRLRELNPDAASGELVNVYGFLPLPDLGTSRNNNVGSDCVGEEGCDAGNFAGNAANITVIGRFPWRKLGLPPLRDGHGECLWYAVSGSHQRIQQAAVMNWDTLGQLDVMVANGGSALVSALTSAHERPVAIIFSAGPPLAGQNRANSGADSVTACGGNYDVANYLDPATAGALGGVTNYFAAATNNASGDTATTNKPMSPRSTVYRKADGTLWPDNCPAGADCTVAANDKGLALTPDFVFGALRKSANFRTDINSMLDRMVGCLRDIGVGASAHPLASNACYDDTQTPRNYFSHYSEQLFAGKCVGNCAPTIDGASVADCQAVLILGGQRGPRDQTAPACAVGAQLRSTAGEKGDACNFLEAPNRLSFTGGGTTYAGQSQFGRSPPQTAAQDIVRCIPAGASFTTVQSSQLTAEGFGQLTAYDAATRTLTLGRDSVESDLGATASALFGCAWTPEVRATGAGFRSYYNFNITDSGDGYVFAAVDGDRNSIGACGAGRQHLGYSGNNGYTAIIAHPKLGIEFDTRRNYNDQSALGFVDPVGFYPAYLGSTPPSDSYLNNGRADPAYTGGHLGVVYWGGESSINTGLLPGPFGCTSPQFSEDGVCKLRAEQDDNVHGRPVAAPATRPPPQNPAAPATPPSPPPYPPYAVDKLDPSLSAVPINQVIHVRVEMERTAYANRDDNSRLVRAVAASNLASLNGLATVDGVVLASGDSVLVAGQADAKANGVYRVSTGAWTRDTSADEGADLPTGTSWFIKEGTSYRGSLWRLQNAEAPIVGSSSLDIQRFRDPVKTVGTLADGNHPLTGLLPVGGVALAIGDRVLLTGQADLKQNGVYTASAGGWSRAALENTTAGMKAGALWFVTGGGQAGTYWRLASDVTPGSSNVSIALVTSPSNSLYAQILTTKVWKLADSVTSANQIARLKDTTRSMSLLDPVVRHAQCLLGNACPATNPSGQTCGGVETDGLRYCYTGHKPTLYDSKTVYDIRTTTSCASNASCAGAQQFCGIDNVCYQPAFRTTRLGFTNGQGTSDQVIQIKDFFTTWLP